MVTLREISECMLQRLAAIHNSQFADVVFLTSMENLDKKIGFKMDPDAQSPAKRPEDTPQYTPRPQALECCTAPIHSDRR